MKRNLYFTDVLADEISYSRQTDFFSQIPGYWDEEIGTRDDGWDIEEAVSLLH